MSHHLGEHVDSYAWILLTCKIIQETKQNAGLVKLELLVLKYDCVKLQYKNETSLILSKILAGFFIKKNLCNMKLISKYPRTSSIVQIIFFF